MATQVTKITGLGSEIEEGDIVQIYDDNLNPLKGGVVLKRHEHNDLIEVESTCGRIISTVLGKAKLISKAIIL